MKNLLTTLGLIACINLTVSCNETEGKAPTQIEILEKKVADLSSQLNTANKQAEEVKELIVSNAESQAKTLATLADSMNDLVKHQEALVAKDEKLNAKDEEHDLTFKTMLHSMTNLGMRIGNTNKNVTALQKEASDSEITVMSKIGGAFSSAYTSTKNGVAYVYTGTVDMVSSAYSATVSYFN